VAAVDQNGAPAGFSSDNLSVQVAAPGVRVPAEGRDGLYWLVSGTSPACALTAGVAALIRSRYPGLPPNAVRDAITSTTTNRPAGGYDKEVGFGTVDAAAALAEAARLSARNVAGPGAPRAGLHRTSAVAPGLGTSSHFGGGPAAVPPDPVGPRGLGQLLLFCVLAVGCLAMIVDATSRLILMRRPGGVPGDLPHGPACPEPSGDAGGPGIPAAWARPVQPHPAGRATPFLWPTAPAGRHAVSRDQPGASEGYATGSPASGPGEA